MVPVLWLLTLGGCLEKVTGEFVPLDPRYTAGHDEEQEGRPPEAGGGGEQPPGGGEAPYIGYEGDMITVSGVVQSAADDAVQIDVFEPDASMPGGINRKGAIRLAGPGEFSFKVPASLASLSLQVFQDPGLDGPSEADPFAETTLPLGGKDPDPITLVLEAGKRGQPSGPGGGGPVHADAAPGAPGGPGGGPAPAPVFPDGPMVTISGTVRATLEGQISLDIFKNDPSSPGGRTFLFKQIVPQGPWSIKVPAEFGAIEIDAYQDPKGDGPTPGDPMSHYEKNPIQVGKADITGVDLLLL